MEDKQLEQVETDEITHEDSIMLLKLIASLNFRNYQEQLGWETMMSSLDQFHVLGADISIIWGHSIIINFGEEYFNRIEVRDDLAQTIFEAMQHFSRWYLKHKTNG